MSNWYSRAKLGVFVHWGVYTVGNLAGESWPLFHGKISREDYLAQLDEFTGEHYDGNEWAVLFKEIGATYALLTTKHHDGICLWDSKFCELNVADRTPFGRDAIGPYSEALRKQGLKVGLYFSLADWTHPDYPTLMPSGEQLAFQMRRSRPACAFPQGHDEPERWQNFLRDLRGQLTELCERYKPDLIWWDGAGERDKEQWDLEGISRLCRSLSPGVLLSPPFDDADYVGMGKRVTPVVPPDSPWEFICPSSVNGGHWSYTPDIQYRSLHDLVRMFTEVIGMGGTWLLGLHVMADGRFPDEEVTLLKRFGAWAHENAEAIYPTGPGLPVGYADYPTTLNQSRDILYVFVLSRPFEYVRVKGILTPARRATVLTSGQEMKCTLRGGNAGRGIAGELLISTPPGAIVEPATVIKVEFDSPIGIYSGSYLVSSKGRILFEGEE